MKWYLSVVFICISLVTNNCPVKDSEEQNGCLTWKKEDFGRRA